MTIELLLDDDLLARGRQAAWRDSQEHIIAHSQATESRDQRVAIDREFRLLQRPNLDAFYAMLRWSEVSSASLLFEPECWRALSQNRGLYSSWIGLA